MLTVTFSRLTGDGDDEPVGTIVWDGTSLTLDPPDSTTLRRVVEDLDGPAVFDPATGREVTPQRDAAAWLAGLHRAYTSAYFRASKPQDPDAPDHGPDLAAAILELKAEGRDAEADLLVRLADDPTGAAAIAAQDQDQDPAAGGPPAEPFRPGR